jgi:hypothetical protein
VPSYFMPAFSITRAEAIFSISHVAKIRVDPSSSNSKFRTACNYSG